jgi:hypothetical protein
MAWAESESEEPTKPEYDKRWIGAYGAIGTQYHIFSANDYKGYKQNALAVFWEQETGPWIPLPLKSERTMRWELRYSEPRGTIEIVEEQVPKRKRDGGPYYVTLDLYQVALIGVRRWVFLPDYMVRPSVHLGLGFSLTNRKILEEGTYYAFNLIGGLGLEADVTKRWSAYFDVRWEHYSNGGKMGLTDADVIGPESINAVFGLRYNYK